MRVAAIVLLLALVAGCGGDDERAAPAQGAFAQLVVRVDADGTGPKAAKELKLDCTSPDDGAACRAAAALKPADFEPGSPKRACTDIFGGPQTAEISGELDGKAVDGRFKRSNGCEVARWEKVAPLLDRVN